MLSCSAIAWTWGYRIKTLGDGHVFDVYVFDIIIFNKS
jgi:hypothetical protein